MDEKKDFVASKNSNNKINLFSLLWTLTRKLNYNRFLTMELHGFYLTQA